MVAFTMDTASFKARRSSVAAVGIQSIKQGNRARAKTHTDSSAFICVQFVEKGHRVILRAPDEIKKSIYSDICTKVSHLDIVLLARSKAHNSRTSNQLIVGQKRAELQECDTGSRGCSILLLRPSFHHDLQHLWDFCWP